MIKKKITDIRNQMEDRLRSLLGQISPDGRIIVVLSLICLFAIGSIYMTVSSIYNMGKKSGQQLRIEHIEKLELQQKQKTDSTNHLNKFDYE